MSAEDDFLCREREDLLKTLDLIDELLARDQLSRFEVISLGTLLHNTYSGVERVLRTRVEQLGQPIQSSPTWHKDLLVKAYRAGIVNKEQFEAFGELLSFRHVHVHGYGHMLEESRLRELAAQVPAFVRGLLGAD